MNEVKISNIIENKNIMSANNYTIIDIKSKKIIPLENLVLNIDKGVEVGSNNYVSNSDFKFIRTSALDEKRYLLTEDENSILSISPNVFVNLNLKKDDVLICKDSNVGETIILDKDYYNYMFSSGINRINFIKDKFYALAIMKHKKFKLQLSSMIPKGATLLHAKNLYLKCMIPYPNSDEQKEYISDLSRIIIDKEIELKNKFNTLNKIIEKELCDDRSGDITDIKYPKISQLIKINRLDTGNYTEEFTYIDSLIKSYKNGYFCIDEKNINGGNTPKKRVINNGKDSRYYWITPSYIFKDGTLDLNYKINCEKNNINHNCMLIINRTSKGGFGEYVGISTYYDYNLFGKAQHNQGLYQVKNYSDEQLIFMTSIINSSIYRKYCANLSMGSKMKELKLNNILSIPFPNFSEKKVKQIVKLYYNKLSQNNCKKENFIKENDNWNKLAGILDLYNSIQNAKNILNESIDKIYLGEDIELVYSTF